MYMTESYNFFSGTWNCPYIWRTYSYLNVKQLQAIISAIDSNAKLPQIDLESIVSTYDGQTIFSLFTEYIEVYEYLADMLL